MKGVIAVEIRQRAPSSLAVQAGLAIVPAFTLAGFRKAAPSQNPAFLAGRERSIEGMRQAGVPEG